MQFLLTAFDGADPQAPERRLKARPEHLEKISVLKKNGEFHFGGAILDDDGQMIGSMIVYEFPDRASLDMRLKDEPYINKGVWEKIEIRPFRLASINQDK
ncbi:MAG TPA: YciI family protein [Bacteroidales bacterium]|nr:YciI family protein [Bacteroidales bacterium]